MNTCHFCNNRIPDDVDTCAQALQACDGNETRFKRYDPHLIIAKWKTTRDADDFYDNVTRAEFGEFMDYIENVFNNMNLQRFEEMIETKNKYK